MSTTTAVVAQQFRSGFWVKDKQSVVSTESVAPDAAPVAVKDNQAFVNIESVTADTELLKMRIYEFDRNYRLVSISIAQKGVYDKSNRWVLSGVEKTTFEKSRARIEKLPVAYWNSAMTPDLLAVLRVQPDEMSMLNLSAYIDHLRENRQNSTRYELALWSKLFRPAAVIIMMLLAIPFAIQSQRAGGVGARLLLGIMIGLGFHFFSQLASHLTVLNDWPPLVSASAPLLVFLSLAGGLIAWKEYATRLPRFAG
jgi:lipopolysaccharide export system permease protein